MWKFHRNMARPYFSRDRVTHFDIFARHADTAISKLLSRLSEPCNDEASPSVDFQDLVSRFTMDSATEFLFGLDTHSLDEPFPYPRTPTSSLEDSRPSTQFSQAFQSVQDKIVARFSLATLWPYVEMFWDRAGSEMRVINDFIRPMLKAKLDARRQGDLKKEAHEESEEGETLLDYLVQHTDGEPKLHTPRANLLILTDILDEKIIKDELFNVLIAGRDTVCTIYCIFDMVLLTVRITSCRQPAR